MKAAFFSPSSHPQHSSREYGNRAHIGAPRHVYTNESRKNSNGAVKMRPLTLPGGDQAVHSPERILSNGESQ